MAERLEEEIIEDLFDEGVADLFKKDELEEFDAYGEDDIAERPLTRDFRLRLTVTPQPGAFYLVQHGKGGLLTTAGRAYGLGPGTERLSRAQAIAIHPENAKFLRAPADAFERRYFPGGLPSFAKIFTCRMPQRRAPSGEKRCYAALWIPSRDRASPLDPVVTTTSLSVQSVAGPISARDLNDWLRDEIDCSKQPVASFGLRGYGKRVDDTERAPSRWTCKIIAIFPPTHGPTYIQGTGVLIRKNRVATSAHVLKHYSNSGVWIPPILVVVIPGYRKTRRASGLLLTDRSAPFGAYLVRRTVSGAPQLFESPEFARSPRPTDKYNAEFTKFDYALIRLDGAEQLRGHGSRPLSGSIADGWFESPLAMSAPRAARLMSAPRVARLSPEQTARLVRRLGAKTLASAGYPRSTPCALIRMRDHIRPPLREKGYYDGKGKFHFQKYIRKFVRPSPPHSIFASRMPREKGMSGGPIWTRMPREDLPPNRRKKFPRIILVLAGFTAGNTQLHLPTIDLSASRAQGDIRFKPNEIVLDSNGVALTPLVLRRLLNESMMEAV